MSHDDGARFHTAEDGMGKTASQESLRLLIRRRGSVKSRLTNFKKFVMSFEGLELTESQRTEIKLRMEGAQSIFAEFNDLHSNIENLVSDGELEKQIESREIFENEYYGILAQTQSMVRDADSSKISSPTNLSQLVKLPTISLPTFDGSYEHWLEFRDTFASLVHSSQEITSIQKFHYLKSSLKGNAQLVIDSLEFSANNYTIAWELLLNRYNNSRLLVHNHVKALFSIQALSKESPSLLRKLIDIILKNLRALKLLGEPTDSWDTLIIYLVVSKLDSTTEREWEQFKGTLLPRTSDPTSTLKVDDLLNFIRDRADMLETLIVTHSKASTYVTHESKKQYQHTNANNVPKLHCNIVTDKSANKSHIKQTTYKKLCLMCNGKHPLYSCQVFLDLNLQDKLNIVQDKRLCENCLRAGHTPIECKYGPCRKCNKKHNSLIHEEARESDVNERAVPRLAVDKGQAPPQASSASSIVNNIAHSHQSRQVNNAHIDKTAQLSPMLPVLLSTALVEIPDNIGNYYKARAILDSGSECCLITKNLCDKLKPKIVQSTQEIRGIGNSISTCTQKCEVEINSVVDTFNIRIQCLVLPQLTSTLPTLAMQRNQFRIPDNICLADPSFFECQSIDILIGADIFWDLLIDGKMRLANGPYLQNTKLGWIISGPIHANTQRMQPKPIRCHFTQSFDTQSLDSQLRRFWDLEQAPIGGRLPELRTDEELACEEHFIKTTRRVADGRFCVQIPLKESSESLGDTFFQAKTRFSALERRLDRDPTYKNLYSSFIKEYENLGHMSRVSSYGTPNYFLPHHGVLREHATTTKLRVVFDASAASTTGKSLNDLQRVGPPIQGDLIAILLRFRENRFVACADIEKHYRQVLIDESQRNLQLILWRDSPNDPLSVYRLNTVTYGTASAPFLSCRCLKQLAQECTDSEVARTINHDFYVDDLICGSSTIAELKRLCKETARVLESGCFPLRKWVYNFDCLTRELEGCSRELSLGEHTHSKTLGLGWYNQSDELHYYTRHDNNLKPVSKRTILSIASQIFDPLGLLSPTITIAKTLLQKLWLLKLDWDEAVPDDVTQVWNRFINNLSILPSIRIPRHVLCNQPIPICTELHIFSDASQIAFGSCAYVRTVDSETAVTVRLLCSKGKVAPISPVSIPRLELCGALVGARLYNKIKDSLRSKFDRVIFWTDSTIVLGWLRMPPNLLKPFVQNRVAEIHELTKENVWLHVSGKDNPADLVSRGLHLDALNISSLWWEGPQYLHDANFDYFNFNSDSLPDESQLPERRSSPTNTLMCTEIKESFFSFTRFSQFNRMQRAAAYVLRFIHNTRNKATRRAGALSAEELRESVAMLARISQQESFLDVYHVLSRKEQVKGHLSKLNLFVDNFQLIRVGGRLANSHTFDFDKRHPILLSCRHQFTVLLFRYEHKQLLHAGPQHLLFSLRDVWWPVSGRNLARKTVHGCVTCARLRGKTLAPIMGNLPKQRLEPGFPFMHSGVDYAGPVLILNRKATMTQVIAVAGEPVYLPCDIASIDEDDAVLLVLWYKEDLGTPIYSVDARERDFGVAERWSDESVFASRAYFLPERRPAELGVDRVKSSDQGIYRCRVDFKQAQTRNSRVNLTVIVPPSKMVITDDKGDVKQAIVGPYVEGDSFTLKCDVSGGRPRPWVKWFRDETETDTPATPLMNNGVRGVLRVGPLTRADVRATLTCRASNHQRAHPIETTLTLDMNFPPLTIDIFGSNQPLSASRRYDLLCQSSGSRPPASITWWKNGHRINNAKETLSTDGNTTTSTVSLLPSKSDAGARLACRASNPQMPLLPPLEDGWTLDIQYVPETTVRLGTNLDPNNIREGSDVYFDCIIKAHPYVYKVEWRHNGKTLLHNIGQGIIISNHSLVLQGVGRRTAGNYTCVGFNAEGDGESKPFSLDVLYAPTCRSSQQRVHGVAKQERAHITCHVDANPPDVTFRWTFNNTANSNEVSDNYVSRAGTSSTVTYTPHTEMDYGTLLCWAHNRIGKQRVPCVYHIIAAGKPDQVHNCTVVNASLTSFGVRCMEGFNGGMPQSFLLEVRELVTQRIVANVSSAVPRFTAVGLTPGRTYAAAVLAYNAKGRGEPFPLRAGTVRPPEKHHVHDKSLDLPRTAFQMSGTMSAAVGGGGVLMIVLVLFMIAVRQRCAKRKPRSAPPPSSQPSSPDKLREKDDSESDDRNPDIIPSDTDQMQMDYYRQQQVSTISPPLGSRGPRGSVAGVRGGLPGYCPLRTAPPPAHPPMHDSGTVPPGIPPPARFASGSCTLPRGTTLTAERCGIPLQHLRTLPRPLPAPAPLPRLTPRDTPL